MATQQANPDGSTGYVALMMFNMKESWAGLSRHQRDELGAEHIRALSTYKDRVAIKHMSGTGLSKYDLIIQLESKDLHSIDAMIEAFKAGRKADQAVLSEIIVMKQGLSDQIR